MINDFYYDITCYANYRFEEDLIHIDAQSTNHLTNVNGVSVDTADFREAYGSARFVRSSSQYFYVLDTDLVEGFPMKWLAEEADRLEYVPIISVCFWVKCSSLTGVQNVVTKYDSTGDKRSFRIFLDGGQLKVSWGYDYGASELIIPSGCTFNTDVWYHVGVGLSNDEKIAHFRVWDDSTQSIVCNYLEELVIPELAISDASLCIGADQAGNNCLDGWLDEVVIFNTYKRPPEIDFIRGQVYTRPLRNSFVDDPTVVSLYSFENPGNVFYDSFGTDHLTSFNYIKLDGSHYKEWENSVRFVRTDQQYGTRADGDLSADWPIKSTKTTDQTFTVCMWLRIASSHNADIFCKDQDVNGKRSFAIRLVGSSLRIYFGINSGNEYQIITVATLTIKRWYHLAVVLHAVSSLVVIRLYDSVQRRVIYYDITFLES